jgi:uncharacterized Zn finger protein
MAYSAGKDVDAWCGKCKKVFRHVIHAVVDGYPVRVECKTCGAVHRFKAQEKASRKKPAAAKRQAPSGRKAKDNSLVEYERTLGDRTEADALPYGIKELFTPDQVIDHVKYGLGIVETVKADRKIEVRFRQGLVTLVHGR